MAFQRTSTEHGAFEAMEHKHRRKEKDTYRNLCEVFLKAQEATLADKVCDVLRGQGNSSEDSSDKSDEAGLPPKWAKVVFQSPPSTSSPKMEIRKVCSSTLYHTDPPTRTTSEIDPLEIFADYLRTAYGVQIPEFVVLEWPPPPTCKVFNLAMICSHDRDRLTSTAH